MPPPQIFLLFFFEMLQVKVMLRVADTHSETATADGSTPPAHFMALDKKKRQVTLTDPTAAANTAVAASTSQERGPMVAAPKMFAFDSLFTADDQQVSSFFPPK